MNKPISRRMHGAADYSYAALVAAAPETFGFSTDKTATTLCRILGGSVLAATLLTRAEWGLVKAIPFKTHLAIDVLSGALTLTAPWLFGFAKDARARNTVLAFGATSVIAGLLTEPEEMPALS